MKHEKNSPDTLTLPLSRLVLQVNERILGLASASFDRLGFEQICVYVRHLRLLCLRGVQYEEVQLTAGHLLLLALETLIVRSMGLEEGLNLG